MDGCVEPAEVYSALAKLCQDAFDVISPGVRRVLAEVIQPEFFALREGGRDDLDSAVFAGRSGDPKESVDRQGQNESFVVIGMISEQFQSPRSLYDVNWRAIEVSSK